MELNKDRYDLILEEWEKVNETERKNFKNDTKRIVINAFMEKGRFEEACRLSITVDINRAIKIYENKELYSNFDLGFEIFSVPLKEKKFRNEAIKFMQKSLLTLDIKYPIDEFEQLPEKARDVLKDRFVTTLKRDKTVYIHILEIPPYKWKEEGLEPIFDDLKTRIRKPDDNTKNMIIKVVDFLLSQDEPEDWFLALKIMHHPLYSNLPKNICFKHKKEFIHLIAEDGYQFEEICSRDWKNQLIRFLDGYRYHELEFEYDVNVSEVGCAYEKLGYDLDSCIKFYKDMINKIEDDNFKEWLANRLISLKLKEKEKLEKRKHELEKSSYKGPAENREIDEIDTKKIPNIQKEINELSTKWRIEAKYSYPTPFTQAICKIDFDVHYNAYVELKIYDSEDRLIKTLVKEDKEIGEYSIDWNSKDENGKPVPKGIYYYQLRVGSFVSRKKPISVE